MGFCHQHGCYGSFDQVLVSSNNRRGVYGWNSIHGCDPFPCALLESNPPGQILFFAGLLGGMSIGVHGSVLLLAPAVLVLLLFEQRKLAGSMKPAAAGAVCGTLLFIAAFVFIDTHQTNCLYMNTYISSASRWGVTADQLERPIGRFVFLVFAQQWRPMMFVDPSEVARGNFHLLVQVLREDFALPVHLLSLIGFCLTWLRKPKLAVFFTVALATHLIFTLNYKIGDIYVFFLSFFEIMLLFCAEGASRFFDLLNRLPAKSQRLVHPLAVVIMFVACLPPYMISPRISSLKMGEFREDFMNLPSNQELETWHTMVRFNAADLPKNAVVLADWYNIYAYTYAAQVELGRPDLLFIEAYPFAYGSNRMADSLLQFLREKMEKGYPVVALQRYDELSDRGFTVQSLPVGVTEMFLIAEKKV